MKTRNSLAWAAVVAAVVLFILSRPGFAQDQDQPEPQILLGRLSETYRNLKRYRFELSIVTESKAEGAQVKSESRSEERVLLAASKPDLLRIELKNPTLSLTKVSDGESSWVSFPALRQYMRKESGAADPEVAAAWLQRATSLVADYESLAQRAQQAQFLRAEAVEVGGRRADCQVVEIEYARGGGATAPESRRTLWIDGARNLVLREITYTKMRTGFGNFTETKRTVNFTAVDLDGPMPESLFAFTPQESDRKVVEFSLLGGARPAAVSAGRADFTGREAVDFTLTDLDGRTVNLRALRGQVVLLNFWATWCGPCVRELPSIERLHRAFKGKGLVTLGVNAEEPSVAREFIKRGGYTFATLVDEQRAMTRAYQVSAIPQTLIIGKDGKVAAHFIGIRSENDLRAALQKAGLGANGIDLDHTSKSAADHF
ncbi:MAG TPA: redoxin domain-containing protein [Blastocatellia bacterium]|nr:redoxin domain-containing protein [Blastocatellia bacterium]